MKILIIQSFLPPVTSSPLSPTLSYLSHSQGAQSGQRPVYGVDDRGSIPGRGNDGICFHHRVQSDSGVHPCCYL